MLLPRRRILAAIVLASVFAVTACAENPRAKTASLFPYKVESKTLSNGLTILVIPTPEFKDMVTYSTVVFAGSRNETEKGKTGLAHLFEHIMFRHEIAGKAGGYEEDIRRIGREGLLVLDSHGVQFLIRDLAQLDRHSRRLLDRFL